MITQAFEHLQNEEKISTSSRIEEEGNKIIRLKKIPITHYDMKNQNELITMFITKHNAGKRKEMNEMITEYY